MEVDAGAYNSWFTIGLDLIRSESTDPVGGENHGGEITIKGKLQLPQILSIKREEVGTGNTDPHLVYWGTPLLKERNK